VEFELRRNKEAKGNRLAAGSFLDQYVSSILGGSITVSGTNFSSVQLRNTLALSDSL
jgi:hypothetical protein